MAWIDKYLNDEEIKNISEAVNLAESGTDGEIVPVIVKRSSSIGHIPLTLTMIILLLFVVLEIPYSNILWIKPWVYLWPVLLVAIYYFSHLLSHIPWIQKVLVPERDEVNQVHQRAQLEFYLNRINATKRHTGILIFVSVMEKKAVILADEGVAMKLNQQTWDEVLARLGGQLRKGDWNQGFITAIETCGQHLKTHFPMETRSENQLKNQLIIKK